MSITGALARERGQKSQQTTKDKEKTYKKLQQE